MPITTAAAGALRIDHGNAASLNNLAAATVLFWLRPDLAGAGSNKHIVHKTNAASTVGWFFFRGGANNITFNVKRATANFSVTAISLTGTANQPMVSLDWNFIAASWTSTGTFTGNFYWGNQRTVVSDFSNVATQGSGAAVDDSGVPLCVSGSSGGTDSYPGDFAFLQVYNRVLSLADIRQIQFTNAVLYGCVLATRYVDINDLRDYSGAANHGTNVGASQSTVLNPTVSAFPNLGIMQSDVGFNNFPIIGSRPRLPFTTGATNPVRYFTWASPFGLLNPMVRPLMVK